MLTAVDIRVRLGGKPILHGVDFTAAAGAVTAIIGPNGSGKTTLLRALTGEVMAQGSVRLDGQDIGVIPAWDMAGRRAVLPQSSRIAFPFTVLEVVRLGLMAGTAGGQDDIPHAALARVGLSGFEGRLHQELSGGEQQRVQLARILAQVWGPRDAAGRARWLLLDEPVAALDIAHQLSVMEIARDHAAQGGGVVAVMHDLNLTAMFADRVSLLQEGGVIAAGRPNEVMTDATLSRAYGCDLRVNTAPAAGATFVLPHLAKPAHVAPIRT